jgi:hypothetical protein
MCLLGCKQAGMVNKQAVPHITEADAMSAISG